MSDHLQSISPRIASSEFQTTNGGAGALDEGVVGGEILVGEEAGNETPVGVPMQGELEEPEPAEYQPVRQARSPFQPSSAEMEEHRVAHIPYRNWCEHCVRGRGLGQAHRRETQASKIPIVALDYFFMTKNTLLSASECRSALGGGMDEAIEKGEIVKCLMMKCSITKSELAIVIGKKGLDQYAVDRVVAFIQWLGHGRVIMKSDNERTIVALLRESLKAVRVELEPETIGEEHSPAYDSQSNGMIENAIRNTRGQFRTLRSCIQERLGKLVPLDHPLIAWMLEHASTVRCAMVRGDDGTTPWQKARGRAFAMEAIGFAEKCHFKLPMKGPHKERRGNMTDQWEDGTFLGYSWTSNEYVYANPDGVHTARAVTRRPISERWMVDDVANLKATPESKHQPRGQGHGLQPNLEASAPAPAAVRFQARSFKIMKRYLEDPRVGYSAGCEQCEFIKKYGGSRPGITHNLACRERIMTKMAEYDDYRHIVEATEERITRALADHVEAADQAAQGARQSAVTEPLPQAATAANDADSAPAWLDHQLPEVHDDQDMQADDGGANVEAYGDTNMGAQDDSLPETSMDLGHVHCLGSNAASPLTSQAWRNSGDDDADRMIGLLDCTAELMIGQMGGCSRSYSRERKTAFNKLVSEVYSPPRVSALAKAMPSYGLQPGFALDLTTSDSDGKVWDFNSAEMRRRARRLVRETRPMFLIGSPMCKAFSTWQNLNHSKYGHSEDEIRRERARAVMHVNFTVELMEMQLADDRFFLFEHPEWASSWKLESLKKLMSYPGVERTRADQCQHGLQAERGRMAGHPVMKPTGFLSNAPLLLKQLEKRCSGKKGWCSNGQRHAPCSAGVAKDAQVYGKELCRAMLRGMQDQLKELCMLQSGVMGIQSRAAQWEGNEILIADDPRAGFSGSFRDDLTGQILNDSLVAEARTKELEYFNKKMVWQKVDKVTTQRAGHKLVSVRWVDVNKGDNSCPNYRSRLVARQLKAHDKSGAIFFAPTPPLEALRTVLSRATTKRADQPKEYRDKSSDQRLQISTVDISRAYFNAKTNPLEPVHVMLPREDPDCNVKVGLLLRHMYGTRRAADGWQEEYSSCLVEMLGFTQGSACPCVFYHPEKDLLCSVHGDDFTTVGPKCELDRFEAELAEHYELKVGPRLGPADSDAKEARVLNRVIRWTEKGIELEADPRQVERLLQENGLEGANAVCTPGVRAAASQVLSEQPLDVKYHTAFRAAAARANYLAQDRPDCQFTCKEICRWMAHPTTGSYEALKRLCRYLVGAPRLVWRYDYQDSSQISVYSDTDWAGCPRTRKSTSGGCILVGKHLIKSWSSTQASVALSSGEAEFYGVVKAAGAGLGYQALMRDFGVDLAITVFTDSTATIGISSRQGLGKLRHLDTTALWIQQAIRAKRIELRKVNGEENPADIFTKHLPSREKLASLMKLYDCDFRDGRAASAPKLRQEERPGVEIKEADRGSSLQMCELPHNLPRDQLDREHPAIQAAEELESYEEELNKDDFIEMAGSKIALEIEAQARRYGRRTAASQEARIEAEKVSAKPSKIEAANVAPPLSGEQRRVPTDEPGLAKQCGGRGRPNS